LHIKVSIIFESEYTSDHPHTYFPSWHTLGESFLLKATRYPFLKLDIVMFSNVSIPSCIWKSPLTPKKLRWVDVEVWNHLWERERERKHQPKLSFRFSGKRDGGLGRVSGTHLQANLPTNGGDWKEGLGFVIHHPPWKLELIYKYE